jgi:signal recognition particle receptor subunit beta
MALVNDVKREINAKIVYVGPKGAGKTTALRYIYGKLKPDYRSELKSSQLGDHQLVFFDFAYPQTVRPDGYSVRFHLYTILIGSGSLPPWKMLLKGADGLVFMADSTVGRLEDTIASSAQLYEALAHYGIRTGDLPISIQCTKGDLPDALPLTQIASETFPELEGAAIPVNGASGEGLLEGLQRVVRSVLQNLGQSAAAAAADETALTVEDKPAVCAAPARMSVPAGLSVASAGEAIMVEPGVLTLPLKLLDAAGACQASFDITVAITFRNPDNAPGF